MSYRLHLIGQTRVDANVDLTSRQFPNSCLQHQMIVLLIVEIDYRWYAYISVIWSRVPALSSPVSFCDEREGTGIYLPSVFLQTMEAHLCHCEKCNPDQFHNSTHFHSLGI